MVYQIARAKEIAEKSAKKNAKFKRTALVNKKPKNLKRKGLVHKSASLVGLKRHEPTLDIMETNKVQA